MFVLKRKHTSIIDELRVQLEASAAVIAQLERRAVAAEQKASDLVEDARLRLRKASDYSSVGEAAYAYANEFEECRPLWEGANQDLWEHAACGAILYGQQHAAEAQIGYFRLGACVPYAIASHDVSQVMTAELKDPVHGGITLKVNGVYLRDLNIHGLEETIRWFSNLVTSPPGWFAV